MTRREFRLRDFRKSDLTELWGVDQRCFRPGIAYSQAELAWYISRRSAFTMVAEDLAGGIAGFIVAHRGRRTRDGRSLSTGHIVTIDVVDDARRSGLGSTLLQAAEERLAREGCDAITLEVAVDNVGAIAFYHRHGYAILRTVPRYYEGELDALEMEKTL